MSVLELTISSAQGAKMTTIHADPFARSVAVAQGAAADSDGGRKKHRRRSQAPAANVTGVDPFVASVIKTQMNASNPLDDFEDDNDGYTPNTKLTRAHEGSRGGAKRGQGFANAGLPLTDRQGARSTAEELATRPSTHATGTRTDASIAQQSSWARAGGAAEADDW